MIEYLVICLSALLAAGLTMYSGFGLGTLLLPVFALTLPVEAAVVATALVHGANNLFKLVLLGRDADREVVLRFGLPAVLAAIPGAMLLAWLSGSGSSMQVEVNEEAVVQITPVKLVIGLMMIAFALFELLPRFTNLSFDRRYLSLGGVLSGFFGGLSGHQGALRSAFLAKSGLDTPAFVGSNAVIGFLVDLTRIAVYLSLFLAVSEGDVSLPWPLVATGSLAAFAGVMLGKRFLHKVTMKRVQQLVGVLLLLVGAALVLGLI